MELEKIRILKQKLEDDAGEALEQLIAKFEDETGLDIAEANISGFGYFPGTGSNDVRNRITVKFKVEAV